MSEYLYYVEQWEDDPNESYPVALFDDWSGAEIYARRLARSAPGRRGARAVARLLAVHRKGAAIQSPGDDVETWMGNIRNLRVEVLRAGVDDFISASRESHYVKFEVHFDVPGRTHPPTREERSGTRYAFGFTPEEAEERVPEIANSVAREHAERLAQTDRINAAIQEGLK